MEGMYSQATSGTRHHQPGTGNAASRGMTCMVESRARAGAGGGGARAGAGAGGGGGGADAGAGARMATYG